MTTPQQPRLYQLGLVHRATGEVRRYATEGRRKAALRRMKKPKQWKKQVDDSQPFDNMPKGLTT
jgi:hypothetical protein